mmetsp:Transcript_3643/g.6375  ORF Transcript_3643/g.6375 Transcript_3643/m.6375 type:complete len:390 (+) Transcript_3643:323-1492(+)
MSRSGRIYGSPCPGTPVANVGRRQRSLSSSMGINVHKPALRLFAAASSLPHPGKKNDGEDAYFVTECGSSLGVSDGVGGWAEIGVDAGMYSRELCDNAARFVTNTGETNPQKIIQVAYDNSNSTGSATMCCLTLQDDALKAANLGDSKFLLLRPTSNGLRVVGESEAQQHYFNCPLQLGKGSNDMPSNADTYEYRTEEGDIVIMGTDGLFDNLGTDEVIDALESLGFALSNDLETLEKLASHLSTTALLVSQNANVMTPFARSARDQGFEYQGGKLDDITVVIAVVAPHFATISQDQNKGETSKTATGSPNPAERFYLPPSAFAMESSEERKDSKLTTIDVLATPGPRVESHTSGSPDSFMSMSPTENGDDEEEEEEEVDEGDEKWHDF